MALKHDIEWDIGLVVDTRLRGRLDHGMLLQNMILLILDILDLLYLTFNRLNILIVIMDELLFIQAIHSMMSSMVPTIFFFLLISATMPLRLSLLLVRSALLLLVLLLRVAMSMLLLSS